MTSVERPLIRIAHAYGNRRHRLERAIEAGVDLIETDVRFYRGEVWVRHEHRRRLLPVLYNLGLRGIHLEGPYSLSLGPLFLRLDLRPIRLREVVEAASGHCGLLLDLKVARHSGRTATLFIDTLLHTIETAGFDQPVAFCGSWRLLDILRAKMPAAQTYHSIDSDTDWERFLERAQSDATVPGVTVHRKMLTEERAASLREAGVAVLCWDVASDDDAAYAVSHGAFGVIADDLDLLRRLAGPPVRHADAS